MSHPALKLHLAAQGEELGTVTPTQQAVVVEEATVDDLRVAMQAALDDAGLTRAEVEAEARAGRFSSEDARRAWFVISSVADLVDQA